ncbi:polysaccharide biosynthesis tyrosine autokinase [Halomonas nitroreducens]|uniref:Polysaccharide biosynthesis tyrosine autokinase n=1 Tax=Halomonas nitroreducens TaxID=447425 RepID=A0A3S0JXK4_9GAMM|nr:polysaccharide biosynthesis tyrosine autokinase [Halomonas nitroreducens]RTR05325.1 polysaccharide biosynthesis tyrosine autokinase [Halomonas nitroreducens]
MNSFSRKGGGDFPPGEPGFNYSPRPANDVIDVGRLLGMLLDNKWLIILTVMLLTIGGIVYAELQVPVYRSDALVQVEKRGTVSPIGNTDQAAGILNQGNNIAAEIEILRSRMVLGKVVKKRSLDTRVSPRKLPVIGDYVLRNNVSRPNVSEMPLVGGLLEKSGIGLQEAIDHYPAVWGGEKIRVAHFDVSDQLRGQPITLKVVGGERYLIYMDGEVLGEGHVGEEVLLLDGGISIKIHSIEAHEGAEFTFVKSSRLAAINALSSRLTISEVGAGARIGSTGVLEVTLTGTDPEELRLTLNEIVDTFLLQNVERQAEATQQSLEFLKKQAPELRAQLASAENRLSEYRASVDSIDLDAEGLSVIEQFIEIERKLNELTIQEAEVAQRFTRNHPTYQSILRQKAYLSEERDRLDQRVNQMPAAQQEVIRRTRDVEVTQAIYVNVLNKLQELELAMAGTVGTLRIIDKAEVGRAPIYPNKFSMVAIASLLGFVMAVFIVIVRGLFNRGVESPDQLENLGFPVYAAIPLSSEQPRYKRRINKSSSANSGVLANLHPEDTAVEAIRGLRTALHFAMMDASNNCLMICGPSPDAGKSFVTLNLSAVCVQGGQNVLVIDSDLRKGNLHRAFGYDSTQGLSEVISGRIEVEEAIKSTGIEGWDFLSRGIAPPNPSELLMSNRFSNLISKVSSDYDLVIMDTPPVLAVTDAGIIGRHAGTTLMVARFQVNPPKEIRLAYSRLEHVGVEVKGCIINGVQRKAATTYGYGYYHYQYLTRRHASERKRVV